MDVRSPLFGRITRLCSEEGKEIKVGDDLFDIVPLPADSKSPIAIQNVNIQQPVSQQVPIIPAVEKKIAGDTNKKSAVSQEKGSNETDRSETRVKMTRMRQRIAQRLKESQNTAAMLTTFQEVDMTNLMELRNRYKDDFEKVHGVKLGFMSAFVRVAFFALLHNCVMYSYCMWLRHAQLHWWKFLL